MQFRSSHIIRYIIISLGLLSVFVGSLIYYFCTADVCSLLKFRTLVSRNFSIPFRRRLVASRPKDRDQRFSPNAAESNETVRGHREISYDKLSLGLSSFDIKGYSVMVFLHIQNTGGSVFARHMIEDLVLERPCHCRQNRRMCQCYRPNKYGSPWFFSRYTIGWRCGVHPDWLELSTCVDRAMDEEEGRPVKRSYFFITVLRDPVRRFLSEFWHVRRGQNWLSSRHWCNSDEAESTELPDCFGSMRRDSLTIHDFVQCPYNLAVNRQTRMLSDLSLVGCYNSSLPHEDRDLIMLASAKANLHKMAFFGLSEFPKVSQYVFEGTFGLNFRSKSEPRREHLIKSARKQLYKEITSDQLEKIKKINHLDMQLYDYAKELLFYRFEKLKKVDPSFKRNFDEMPENDILAEDWAEKEDFMSFLANDFD